MVYFIKIQIKKISIKRQYFYNSERKLELSFNNQPNTFLKPTKFVLNAQDTKLLSKKKNIYLE